MKLLVLDGNSLVNRAFYAIRMLSNSAGLPTNAVFGFMNIYLRLLEEEKPDGVCVAFDRPEPTFRRQKYDGYKAQRKGMPEELALQMPYVKQLLGLLGVHCYEQPGWEADDILGTMARICGEKGVDCTVVTGDRDSLQLVSDTTSVRYVTAKGAQGADIIYTPEVFKAEYGFEPIKLIDLKALMGDSSDNIPGVAGVGQKTAMDLVQRFGYVEDIYALSELPGVKPSVLKKLAEGKDQCILSKWLATINCDAPIDFEPENSAFAPMDEPALYELLSKLELKKLIDRLNIGAAKTESAPCEAEVCAELCGRDEFFSFAAGLEHIYFATYADYLAVGNGEEFKTLRCDNSDINALLSLDAPKTGHAVKELMVRCAANEVKNLAYDTAIAVYLTDPSRSDYSVQACSERELSVALYGGKTPLEGDSAAAEAAKCAKCVFELEKLTKERIEAAGMSELYYSMELPLVSVIARIENHGFLVDREGLESFGKWLTAEVSVTEEEIFSLAGERFNINSTKMLGHILFEKLGLPPVKKTKSGYSTDIEVLNKLEPMHEIVPCIIKYRKLTKLKSTYAEGLLKVIAPDGRIHTTLNMTATATGRLSSTEPNLQNIPVRGQLGSELRKFFVAPEGSVLIDADYSQIELRVLAHIANDENMKAAFSSGADIHKATASQVFGVPIDEVSPQMRSSAKAVNFGIVYGMSDFALSQDIGVTRAEARRYMDAYLENFSGVRAYMQDIVKKATEDGFVSTLYGRRRYLPELASSNRNIKAFGERVALNAPIQGSAADIIKFAMIAMDKALTEGGYKARLILQVHDELIVESPEEEAEAVKALLIEKMESAVDLAVRMKSDAGVGKTWYEAKA